MQIRRLPWMALFWISFSVSALDINEELFRVRLLEVYPGNIGVLSRGLEDGITVGTHAKLRSVDGYVARAICVKSGTISSQWRFYRIVNPELISKEVTYTLVGIDASEYPEKSAEWLTPRFEKNVPDFDEKKLLPKPAVVTSDLPNKSEGRDLDRSLRPDDKGLFSQKNFDAERLRKDFSLVTATLYASPWSQQKAGNTNVESFKYGGKINNSGKKYGFNAYLDRNVLRAKEKKSGEKVINEGLEAGTRFSIKSIAAAADAYSDLTFRQARYGADASPKRQILFAPVGFSFVLPHGRRFQSLRLSYAPTYDTRVHETRDEDGHPKNVSDSGLRHAFGIQALWDVTKDFQLSADFKWRPLQDMSSWGIDYGDNLSQAKFVASWKIIGSWYMQYEYQWLDDAQLRRINHLSRVVTSNSLNVSYNFEL